MASSWVLNDEIVEILDWDPLEASKRLRMNKCQFYDKCLRTDEKLKDRKDYVSATGEQCFRNGEGCEQLPVMLNAKEFNY